MSNDDQTYSADFKREVAGKALERDKKNLEKLSREYDVPVSKILSWAVQLEKNPEFNFAGDESSHASSTGLSDHEEVTVQVDDDEISGSILHGVMSDKINIRRLTSWSLLGTALAILFVIGVREMYEYNRLVADEAASNSTEYYEVNQQKKAAEETLNSFGVVDLENGVYRIPIDSAINEMVQEN